MEELDSRSILILGIIARLEEENIAPSFNRLYRAVCVVDKMPLQTFFRKLKKLVDLGLVKREVQIESRLPKKPVYYRLSKQASWVLKLYDDALFKFIMMRREKLPKLSEYELTALLPILPSGITYLSMIGLISEILYSKDILRPFLYFEVEQFLKVTTDMLKKIPERERVEKILPLTIGIALWARSTLGLPLELPEHLKNEIRRKAREVGVDPDKLLNEIKRMEQAYRKKRTF